MLSTKKWAPLASWTTGWLTLVGNWTVTTSIAFSGGQLMLSSLTVFDETFWGIDPVSGTALGPNALQTVGTFWVLLLVCASINIFFSKHLDAINTICVYWTALAVVIIFVVLLACTPEDQRNDAQTVFSHFDASASGWSPSWAFFVGLLQAAYTLTGYGMVASMCEEVQSPEKEVPRGMILSVAAAAVTGIIFLLPVLFTLPLSKIKYLLDAPGGMPIGLFFKLVTGSTLGGFSLLALLLGIVMFAGIGALTAASRCTYAFARDGAIPGSEYWKQVSHKYETPIGGLALSTTICALLGLIYFGSTAAFNAFMGVATICLSASYGLPVLVSVLQRRSKIKRANAPFQLNQFLGYFVNGVTLVWIVLATVIFCMPVSIPVTAETMNYASAVFMGFFLISATWYVLWGRTHFHGPPTGHDHRHLDDNEQEEEEEEGVEQGLQVGGYDGFNHYYGAVDSNDGTAGIVKVPKSKLKGNGIADCDIEHVYVVEGISLPRDSSGGFLAKDSKQREEDTEDEDEDDNLIKKK